MVYFLEYTITTAFTVASTQKILKALSPDSSISEDSFTIVNAFVIFNLCYQVGVFISRSSLSCVKIERVWTLTVA